MTVHANVQNVQPLRDDLYIHNKSQQQCFLGNTGQETPGEAQKLITQAKRVYNLWHDGTWHIDYNIEGQGAQIITTAYFTPLFRVRAFKLYIDSTTLFGRIAYDTPESQHALDDFATGVLQQVWITRLHLNDCYEGTQDAPFRISLFG